MRINSVRSGLLEFLSSCVVHILYFDDFHSTPLSLTPSKSVQKSPKWDTKCCNWHLISQTHTPISPLCLLYSCKTKTLLCKNEIQIHYLREGSGSVVECLTQDRGAAGSSLTGVTVLWSLSKVIRLQRSARHIYPSLVLVHSRKTSPCLTERLLMGHKESNQTNKKSLSLLFAFLNSLGKQEVSPGSINQRVETALLFLCACF